MKIRTIHPKLISGVDGKLHEFVKVESQGKLDFYEGEVPEEVGKHLLQIKRTPWEYTDITPAPAPAPEIKIEIKPEIKPEAKPTTKKVK